MRIENRAYEWEITDLFEFVHLCIADDQMRRMFAETFDRDARLMALPEVTFEDGPAMAPALRKMMIAISAVGHLLAEEAMTQTIDDFFIYPRYGGKSLH